MSWSRKNSVFLLRNCQQCKFFIQKSKQIKYDFFMEEKYKVNREAKWQEILYEMLFF